MNFNRPIALMCYICGREYGTKSLEIHLKTCKQKWEIEENKKPRNQRRPLPLPPAGLEHLLSLNVISQKDIEEFNNGAFNKYNNEALIRCPNCNRTFKPEALAHHQKACSPSNPFKPLGPPGGGGMQQPSEYPAENDAASLQPCSFCGRKFAGDRIAKHESVCNKNDGSKLKTPAKTLNEVKSNSRLPSSEQKSSQNQYQSGGGGGGNSNSAYTSPVKQIVRPKTLVCYICGREFGTASLSIHLKSCEQKWEIEQSKLPKNQRRPCPKPPQSLNLNGGGMNANDIQNYNNQAFNAYNTDALMPCKFCNRTFTSTALDHHKKVCTAEKPFKPLTRPPPGPQQQQQQQGQDVNIPKGAYNLGQIDEGYQEPQDLVSCGKCGRNFASDRIQKHEKVCKGPIEKKVVIEPPKVEKKKPEGEPQWKKQHEEFIESMKQMRQLKKIQEQGGDIRSLPPPKPSNTDHLIPCPYCNRKFNDQAAEKHIPACKNTINKPKSVAQSAPNTFKMMQQMTSQNQMIPQQKQMIPQQKQMMGGQMYGSTQQQQMVGGQKQQMHGGNQQMYGGQQQLYGGNQQMYGVQQKAAFGNSQQQFKMKK